MINNKAFIILLLFFATITGCAQVQVISTEKLQLPETGKFYHPKLDDSGNLLLMTSENYQGLKMYNLKSKEMKLISEAEGAGYSPLFTHDGQTIVFNQNENIQNRLYSRLMAYHILRDVTDEVAPASRDLSMISATKSGLVFRTDGKLKTAAIDTGKSGPTETTGINIENRKLVFYTGSQSRSLDPFENESYIWPSLSPDGTRILAYAMGKGAFICDTEGKLIRELGNIEAPVWVSDDYITGMITQSDGHQILAAEVFILDVHTGKKLSVSPDGVVSMYPTVSLTSQKIAFQSLDGDIYIVTYDIIH